MTVCPHCGRQTFTKTEHLNFEILTHALYIPTLAPCDFHLFPLLKDDLKGHHFNSDIKVQRFADAWCQCEEP